MNELIARRVLGRDPLPGEAPNILDEYANTSSAGSVIAFHKHSADLKRGDMGLLCSFGAGYSAGSVILRKGGLTHSVVMARLDPATHQTKRVIRAQTRA
jgi:beta-ketodecanoyl-[acyl-carrier-protein] synthase